ncbi:MAG: LamG domain-containing protein [Candidatus Brocadiae bacterium]|nr:LamG domain-containing protein [Candidatus Brocadiia bacterium]
MNDKTWILLVCVFFMLLSSGQSDTTSGLLAYYSFSGNAQDMSGQGHHGTVNGADLTTDRFGNANSAYYFNGSGDIILIGSNFISPTAITLSAWIKKSGSYSSWNDIIAGNNGSPIFGINPSNQLAFGCQSNSPIQHLGSATISDVQWHHVAATYNGSWVKVYLDGALVDSRSASGSFNTSNVLGIGGDPSRTSEFFSGLIDDVRIYNRALADSDVLQLTNETSVPENSTFLLAAIGIVLFYALKKNQ